MNVYPIQHRVPTPATPEPPRPSSRVPLEGCGPLVVSDLAPGAWTTQSSANPTRGASFARPTHPGPQPYWAVDLQRAVALERIVLRLADLPPGTRVRLYAFTTPTPAGGPPATTCIFASDTAELPLVGVARAIDVGTFVVARFVWIALEAATPVVLEVLDLRVEGAPLFVPSTLAASYARSFSLFADKPLFLARERVGEGSFVVTHTFREVWEQGIAVARALDTKLAAHASERVFVVLAIKNRPAWIVLEIACILLGYVVVPLAPDEPEERLLAVLRKCPPHVVVCEHDRRATFARLETEGRARPIVIALDPPSARSGIDPALAAFVAETVASERVLPATYEEDALFTILFTSGSTGVPKGAMRSFRKTHAMLVTYGVPQPAKHLSFQPLSHLSERHYMPAVVLNGGVVAFGGGGASLTSDLADLAPSWVSSVPRLFDVLRARYERAIVSLRERDPARAASDVEAEALREARGAFGASLQGVSTGSAPVSAETLRFLERCFADIWLFDGYGSTEVGTIAASGRVPHDVDVKLAPVEGQPEGRGEILVRSPHVIDGYFGDDEASQKSLDADGFFRTGDLGERTEGGGVRVVGRLASAVKLGQGDFVSVDRVEAELGGATIVDRIFVHPAPSSASLVAVVVPRREVLAGALAAGETCLADLCADRRAEGVILAALRSQGRERGLRPHEIPSAVVVEPRAFTVESRLLTASGKLARREAIATYTAAFVALEARASGSSREGGGALVERIVAVACEIARRDVAADEPLADGLGQDSLATAELLAALEDTLGHPIPLRTWFRARTLADLARAITTTAVADDTAELATRDRALLATFVATAPLHAPGAPRRVLLTGATGLLGAHLLEELARTTDAEIVCVVRAADGASARERVERTLLGYEIEVDPSRFRVVVGDLALPGLGMDDDARGRLANDVDAIVHAAADVNWLHRYESVRAANVLGTAALLELAATTRAKPFSFVSTISTAPVAGDEASFASFEEAASGSGYGLSKWVAEDLVRTAISRGLPATVHRPGLITGHSARGRGNADDFVHRYLAACVRYGVALDRAEILDMSPADYVSRAIVASIGVASAPAVTHLCNMHASFSYAALGRALAANGYPCRLVDPATFRRLAVLPAESPLRPLVSYFPQGSFVMGSGPWPARRTVEWLRARGIVCPVVDDGLVGRMVRALVGPP